MGMIFRLPISYQSEGRAGKTWKICNDVKLSCPRNKMSLTSLLTFPLQLLFSDSSYCGLYGMKGHFLVKLEHQGLLEVDFVSW